MPIVPDAKDWTWVLERPCPECGFDAAAMSREEIAPAILANGAAWPAILAEPGERLRRRPSDDRWSPLEYACHVRDVLRLYEYRLHLMLDLDHPTFPNWDQDVTAVEERYDEADPQVVSADLVAAAQTLSVSFAQVEGEVWSRRGLRSDGADFSIDTFARYLIHDPVHHLYDVRQDLG